MTSRPNELWQVDIICPIETEFGRNKFIFLAIDHFLKWVEAKVINDKKAEKNTEAIKILIIDRHGLRTEIMSNNGLEFENTQCKKMTETRNVKWRHSSPYHHEAVGGVERANQTLMEKIRKLSSFGETPSENILDKACFYEHFF